MATYGDPPLNAPVARGVAVKAIKASALGLTDQLNNSSIPVMQQSQTNKWVLPVIPRALCEEMLAKDFLMGTERHIGEGRKRADACAEEHAQMEELER